MKRILTATCLAMFCAAGLAAQTQPADQQKKAADPAKADAKSVTLTGCLRAGDTPNSFVLANVKTDESGKAIVSEPAPATPPTTPPTNPPPTAQPPSGAPVGTSGATNVRLVGAPATLDLAKHVGHTVSITGTFVPAGKGTPSSAAKGAAAPAASDARSVNVKSMAHISDTCK